MMIALKRIELSIATSSLVSQSSSEFMRFFRKTTGNLKQYSVIGNIFKTLYAQYEHIKI